MFDTMLYFNISINRLCDGFIIPGLSIVIIIAVAFVVGAFILCIGIIMFRK